MSLLYVDDMIITRDYMQGTIQLKQFFNSQFEMKDFGHLNYFSGLEICYDDVFIIYHKQNILLIFNLMVFYQIIKLATLYLKPMSSSFFTKGVILDDFTFNKQLIESCIYLTTTRSNIIYIVHIVS